MYNLSVVPSFVLMQDDGNVLETIEGIDDVTKLMMMDGECGLDYGLRHSE